MSGNREQHNPIECDHIVMKYSKADQVACIEWGSICYLPMDHDEMTTEHSNTAQSVAKLLQYRGYYSTVHISGWSSGK